MKLKTIGMLIFATSIVLISCQKEDTREGFLPKPKPQTAKGFMECLINGKAWPGYGNSSNRVTIVDFTRGEDIIELGYEKCDSFSSFRLMRFATYYPSGNGDMGFSFFIKAKTGVFQKLYSSQLLDYQNPVSGTILCQQLPKFNSGIIWEIDAPLGNYYLDTDFDNVLTISAISDSIIEGSFHIKYLESNYARGSNNPNGVPDSLEFDCKKFRAVLTTGR